MILNENMPSPQNYENRQMSKNINNVTNDKNNMRNYENQPQYPALNERQPYNNDYQNYVRQQQYPQYERNQINNQKIYEKEQINIPKEPNYPKNPEQINYFNKLFK